MDGLLRDDISEAKDLKDLIISQMQSMYGPEYGHNMHIVRKNELNDHTYTKFDVVFVKLENVWHARGIVYLRSERPSITDINDHKRYKVLVCGKSELNVVDALQDLWNVLQEITKDMQLLRDIRIGQIYPNDVWVEFQLVGWLRAFAAADGSFD